MTSMIPSKKDYTLVIHCNYDTYLQFINTYLKAKRIKKFKNHEQFLLSMLHLYENAMVSERLRP
ncbi:MAG: hypothetical protein ACPLVI_05990 [Thermoplasmata archaeon]